MKKKTLLFLLLIAISTNSKATNWITSYESAKKLAAATNKLIIVDFWATWCGPCKKMDSESWSDSGVKELMSNFIPLKIDIDFNRNLALKYDIRSIPDVFIMDANGEIIYHNIGYMSKLQLIKLLKKYSYKTEFLQKDLIDFMNKNSSKSALNIAEKYFDFSIYVKKNVRNDFLKLGEKYLKKARITAKKEDAQKIGLLGDSYTNLIKGKYKKALKKIDDEFKETDIKEENKLLYTFIKFTAYNKLSDKENAKIWYEKLKLIKNYKKTLLKSRKI